MSSDSSSISNQPDNIGYYVRTTSSLKHTDKTFINLTFADLYESCNSFIWQPGWKFPLDVMDNDSFLYCSLHIIYDILKCRWIDKSSDFNFDGEVVSVRTKLGRDISLIQYMKNVWGLKVFEKNVDEFGYVKLLFSFDNIPENISYDFDFSVSNNIKLVIGSDLSTYEDYEVLRNIEYDYRKEYMIFGRACSTKCVFRYPKETIVYAAEIV